MYRATTPTHIFTLPFEANSLKDIQITYKQEGKIILQKNKSECEIVLKQVKIELTQEETLLFQAGPPIYIQLRVVTDENKVLASDIVKIQAKKCLDEEVL